MAKIISAEFVKSIGASGRADNDDVPEICFIGRSNVGKSSTINSLVTRRIARTSSTPGATRTINIFKICCEFDGKRNNIIFSDFPGFGFSKVSRAESQSWQSMIENYILENKRIKKIVWLFDVRRQMDHLDTMLLEWLIDNNLDFCFVLTKSDKEKQSDLIKKKRFFDDYLKKVPVFLFSSKTGKGKNELVSYLINSAFPASNRSGYRLI